LELEVLSRSEEPNPHIRIGYISRASEAEVEQRALECMADEEAVRVEICRVILHPLILADGAEYWLD